MVRFSSFRFAAGRACPAPTRDLGRGVVGAGPLSTPGEGCLALSLLIMPDSPKGQALARITFKGLNGTYSLYSQA